MRHSALTLLLAALATCTLLNMAAATNTVPKLNQPAPEFSGTALVNGAFKDISKADYAGKWVVLFFYPMDFTFVCPTEICAFNDRLDEFHAIGAEVIGVSVDSHFTHLAWTQKSRKEGGLGPMDLTLLADKSHAVTKAYGVQVEDGPDAGVSYRGLFIIDPSGNLRQITVNDLPVGRSVDETLRLVQAFQFVEEHGEVCPANWKPGKATIKPDASASLEFFGAGHTEAAAGAEAKKARTG